MVLSGKWNILHGYCATRPCEGKVCGLPRAARDTRVSSHTHVSLSHPQVLCPGRTPSRAFRSASASRITVSRWMTLSLAAVTHICWEVTVIYVYMTHMTHMTHMTYMYITYRRESDKKKPASVTCIPVLAVLWPSGSLSDRRRDWALLLSQLMKSAVMCYSIRGLHVLCLCGWSRQAGTLDTNAKWNGRSASTYTQTHTHACFINEENRGHAHIPTHCRSQNKKHTHTQRNQLI